MMMRKRTVFSVKRELLLKEKDIEGVCVCVCARECVYSIKTSINTDM